MLLRQKHTNAINMAALYSSLNRKQKAQSLPAFILPANKERNSNNRQRRKVVGGEAEGDRDGQMANKQGKHFI